MSKMDEDEIITHLVSAASDAIGPHDGELAKDVERSFDYYMGKPYGDEVEGRSKFTTREVMETIEGMMPYLTQVFFSSDQACVFDPEDEDDIDGARQETEYVNSVFYKENPGFEIGYDWIKDGLMNKVGVVKAVREGDFSVTYRRYRNLTEDQLALLLTEYDGEKDAELEQNEDGTYNVKCRVSKETHRTVIYNVPPESFRISEDSRDVQSAYYAGETYEKSISELREMGLEVDEEISDSLSEDEYGGVKESRHEDVNENQTGVEGADRSGVSRVVSVNEEYIYLDADGDGKAELIKVIRVGRNILERVEVDSRPYYTWGPVRMPHKFYGLSVADLVMDIQRLKSRLWRNILDNQFLQINGRYAVVDGQVNLDDMMASMPHGIVRENFTGAVRDLPVPKFGREVFEVMGLVDQQTEKRTGVSERSIGLDPRAFNSNTAMGTAEMVMTAAEQKLQLIARLFAETGLKKLLLGIHKLGMQFEKPGRKMRTNNGEFIPLDPDTWKDRSNMTITVGIGNGSKTHQMMQINQIMSTQQAIVSGGGLGTLVTPEDIYNLAMEQTRVLGRKDGNQFYTRPESNEVPKGPSIEEQVKMIEAQTEQVKAEAEIALDEQKLEIQAAEQALKEEQLQFEKEKLAFEQRKHADEVEFKLAELQLEKEQERATLIGKERD